MIKKFAILVLAMPLVFFGCTTSQVAKSGDSPQEMLRANKTEEAKKQFMTPGEINAQDENGDTVLHVAAEMNDAQLCSWFIFNGADPEIKNYNSDTPLHVAIAHNSYEAAEAIIKGAPSTIFSHNGDFITALDMALERDSFYYDVMVTPETGEVKDDEGQTIVHYFAKTGNLSGIEKCIDNQLPLSVADSNGKTPLDIAFENISSDDSVQIAAALILAGAEEVNTSFSYFQDAVSSRNLSIRFDDGQTPLHFAAIFGHESIAKYLLENNADTKAQDSSGATPLHEAVRYGNVAIAKLLLDAGANVNAKDNLGKTPVMLAVPKDKVQEIYSLLISYRADLSIKDMYGDTVLHTAAMMNIDENVLSMLVGAGAEIDAKNKEGVTPLEIAVLKNNVNTIRLLTANGANIHTSDTNGKSPLLIAFEADDAVFEALVNSSNVSSQDSKGNTPLHLALLNNVVISKIQYIISLTDDVNIRNSDGNSALFICVLKNRQKVGEMLMAKDADIFSTNTNNNSPLRLALKYGGSVQDWLITSKTIKATDGSGNTALHYAAEWEYADAIQGLLTKGADISARNANGETALFSAVKSNNPKIINVMIDGGSELNARDNLGSTVMHTAVRWDAPASLNELIRLGVDVNAQNSSGKSPLAEAVLAGKLDMAQTLLKNGANPNSSDTNGVTVLMDSIRGGNKDAVATLLKGGANPNVQSVNGQNAYHEAAYRGDIEIINMIRNAGGNPLSRDKNGKTPLSIVIKSNPSVIRAVLGKSNNITDSDGNTPVHIVVKEKAGAELLQSLIKDGFPIDTRNADGYTALNYAIENNMLNYANVLLAAGANPFQMIDKKGRNGVTIALEKNKKQMIMSIVKYAGKLSDVQGNTILHYAAKNSSATVVKELLACGLDKSVKNVSGDTAYTTAIRWKRADIAELLK